MAELTVIFLIMFLIIFIGFTQQITKLKIDSNPFAKGFRDSSRLTDLERYVFVLTQTALYLCFPYIFTQLEYQMIKRET